MYVETTKERQIQLHSDVCQCCKQKNQSRKNHSDDPKMKIKPNTNLQRPGKVPSSVDPKLSSKCKTDKADNETKTRTRCTKNCNDQQENQPITRSEKEAPIMQKMVQKVTKLPFFLSQPARQVKRSRQEK